MSSEKAETFSITKTMTEDGLKVKMSGTIEVLLQVPLSEKENGDNLSKQGVALAVMAGGLATEDFYEPDGEVAIPPCKHAGTNQCLKCKNGARPNGETVTDCPFATRKAKENIVLSFLAEEGDEEAAARLKAWLDQKQAEGQAKAAADKAAKEVKE